ncbi:MAG TPA: YetF domain-containing protein [Vicinamibacterales bacterium]|nr:YetF domain-containing protein [Vicinamibacterales bacterium]
MEQLWHLDAPWWTIALRALLIYVALLIFVRVSGKRTVGEFTPFDLVVLILIGEASQNGLIGDDHSVFGAWIAAGTLIAINLLFSWLTARSRRIEQWVDGRPEVLARQGQILDRALRRNNVSRAEFDQVLRASKCTLDEVSVALLEVDGEITVIKNGEKAPMQEVAGPSSAA